MKKPAEIITLENAGQEIQRLQRRLTLLQKANASLKHQLHYAEKHNESTLQWAYKAFDEQRRLSERCTFLYGAARAHGATSDELRGS